MAGNEILLSTKPDIGLLPGGWEPDESLSLQKDSEKDSPVVVDNNHSCLVINHVISPANCQELIGFMGRSPNFESVSVQGCKDIIDDRIGSIRTTIWSPELSSQLWQRIAPYIPERTMDLSSATDWWQGNKERLRWKPIAMSPLLRFMQYSKGGQHYSHYDAGFIYPDDNYRTLQSVVIYLTDAHTSGATRFIRDNQQDTPVWERNHLDWSRPARSDEVTFRSIPQQGKVIVFDHRICHDVEPSTEAGPRIIIRADIVFEAIDD